LISNKKMKILIVAAMATLALGAITVSSASASIIRGKFSTSSFKLYGTSFTVKKGAESKTCTPATISVSAFESSFFASNTSEGTKFTCTDASYLLMVTAGEAKYDTVADRYYLFVGDQGQSLRGPWGWYFQLTGGTDNWTWVNGSGSTPSTMTLNEQWVGYKVEPYEKITISGTFTAKTSSGGLVTLSH
jgi:hypothetical protein